MSRRSASRFHGGEISAAGEVEGETEASEVLEQGSDAVDEALIGRDCSAGERGGAGADVRFEAAEVFVLKGQGLIRLAAALADAVGELDHLVDRLLAVQAHDVVEDESAEAFFGFARQAREGLDEHGDHDFGPALADQGDRAVEIEEDMADLRARGQWTRKLDRGPIVLRMGWVDSGSHGRTLRGAIRAARYAMAYPTWNLAFLVMRGV